MTDKEFLEREIARWKNSSQRIMQIKGHLYYENEHDILARKRTVIGEGGEIQPVDNLPNNRVIDNQYGKMVNQKANYLLGKAFVIDTKNEQYAELLKKIFNKSFMKTLKMAARQLSTGGSPGYTLITMTLESWISGYFPATKFSLFGRTANIRNLILQSGFIW